MFGKKSISREKLRRMVAAGADSYENYADAPAAKLPNSTMLGAEIGNPEFDAQFDVTVLLKYFTVVQTDGQGAYTPILAAALHATLQNKLPAFFFGNSDFAGGFARLRAATQLTNWTYDAPFIYGTGGPKGTIFGLLDANARAVLSVGDLVIPCYATVGGTNYVSFTIIRCTQVAFGTLLGALSSDMFRMNMIRYILSASGDLAQYTNNINIFKQSLFGKFDSDFVSPNSFKLPEQNQDLVIDIPLKKGIDKQIALAVLVDYTVLSFQWSIFVSAVDKRSWQG